MDGQSKRRKVDANKNKKGSGYAVSGDDDFFLPTSITFTSDVDGLQPSLKIFKDAGAKITQLESRPSKSDASKHDFLVGLENADNLEDVCKKVIGNLKEAVPKVEKHGGEKVPWFPRHISDLDKLADRVLTCGDELEADHPGFTDPVYRKRRKEFSDIAMKYKYGEKIPFVEYTDEEIKTWGTVLGKVKGLYPTHACKEINEVFPKLVEECDYRIDNIPQLEDVSNYLKKKTGFSVRPIAGLLSSRDFLNGLAFRVFHSTQYIRHSSVPMYTPEPDVCHELIGHVPLFSNPEFARFSQEIGLFSLGISDEWVKKLATLYTFTVEFGLCRQHGEIKAYGAGLLSAFGELQYSIESDKCERREFIPEKACVQEYPITSFQPVYFVAESFEDAKEKLKSWAERIPRPVSLHYNPYTQTVEVIENKDQISSVVAELKSQVDSLQAILKNMN